MSVSPVSPYALVNVVRLRAAQLADGAPPAVEVVEQVDYEYPVRIAVREVHECKLRVEFTDGPPCPPTPRPDRTDAERFVPGLEVPTLASPAQPSRRGRPRKRA